MTYRKLLLSLLVVLMISLFVGAHPAAADSSHARIIRLSLVQGDVRFARETHGDPLADSNATWENAGLNLPIRQGYVLATDNGRAEVEFENGAMAFLKEHTVLEFYDLSLNDSERTTRLVLRQGSAAFYVNPAGGDYFSVTGGDFTVEALGRSEFRLDTFDDGSTVETLKGRVNVLHKKEETRLQKGQSLSMKAGDDSVNLGILPGGDDFDQWVSGQIESVSAATAASQQYTGSSSYVPGFASLYTYGAFANCGAYGYGWRPFGAGLGWSPFTSGQWIWDPASGGYAWLSYQPWGWAPYHYGGWLFDASCGGWFYSPPLFYGYAGYPGGSVRRFPKGVHPPRPIYHPATAVFVRNGGKTGIVPMHPLDAKGKTPLNLERGVFSVEGNKGVGAQPIPVERGQKWETLKSPPREAMSNSLVASGPPARVFRSVEEGKSGVRVVSLGKDSSIVYDPREHRFVNTNSPAFSSSANEKQLHAENGKTGAGAASTPLAGTPPRSPAAPPVMRSVNSTPPSRVNVPPAAPRYSGGADRGTSSASSRGSSFGGGSSTSSASSSGRSSSASSSSSSSSASHPSSGRPH